MSLVKRIFKIEVREQFEVVEINASEFANRLRVNTDAKMSKLFSRVQSQFWGMVNKNSFEINTYQNGITIRGTVLEQKGKLLVSLVYARKNVIIPLMLIYCCLAALAISNSQWGFFLFLTLFLILFIVGGSLIMNKNIKEISCFIKDLVDDKQIHDIDSL